MSKNKTLRTRDAGAIVEQVCYNRIERSDDSKVRAEKRKKTTEVMRQYNHKSSIRKFELMLSANFKPGDVVGTVTYDDDHLPPNRKAAERRFRYFRKKLERHYQAAGIELVVFWSTESKHGDGRLHHHFIMPSTGDDYDAIRAAWIYGGDIELKPLRVDKEKNYRTLAVYYAKEARDKLGLRAWTYTRNAKKPEEDTERVENDYRLSAPDGVIVLEKSCIETPFGSFEYLKYMRPWLSKDRVKVRRRRRKT